MAAGGTAITYETTCACDRKVGSRGMGMCVTIFCVEIELLSLSSPLVAIILRCRNNAGSVNEPDRSQRQRTSSLSHALHRDDMASRLSSGRPPNHTVTPSVRLPSSQRSIRPMSEMPLSQDSRHGVNVDDTVNMPARLSASRRSRYSDVIHPPQPPTPIAVPVQQSRAGQKKYPANQGRVTTSSNLPPGTDFKVSRARAASPSDLASPSVARVRVHADNASKMSPLSGVVHRAPGLPSVSHSCVPPAIGSKDIGPVGEGSGMADVMNGETSGNKQGGEQWSDEGPTGMRFRGAGAATASHRDAPAAEAAARRSLAAAAPSACRAALGFNPDVGGSVRRLTNGVSPPALAASDAQAVVAGYRAPALPRAPQLPAAARMPSALPLVDGQPERPGATATAAAASSGSASSDANTHDASTSWSSSRADEDLSLQGLSLQGLSLPAAAPAAASMAAGSVAVTAQDSQSVTPAGASVSAMEQRSAEWYALREGKLTASAFVNAVGFFPEGRVQLWEEKVGLKEPFQGNEKTVWGTDREAEAVEAYTLLTGNSVEHIGFKVRGWMVGM